MMDKAMLFWTRDVLRKELCCVYSFRGTPGYDRVVEFSGNIQKGWKGIATVFVPAVIGGRLSEPSSEREGTFKVSAATPPHLDAFSTDYPTTFLHHHTLYLTTNTASASRGAYSLWLVSVFSPPSPLLSKLLPRLLAIYLLGHPSYLALHIEIINPDQFQDHYVEYFRALSTHSMIPKLCASSHLPRHP